MCSLNTPILATYNLKGLTLSNVLEDTISIEGFRGLFIKNTVGLKCKQLTAKDYKSFKKEKELYFVMRTTSPTEVRRHLTPIRLLGREVSTVISLAYEERKGIIENLKKGIDDSLNENDAFMTIEDLWNEYTTTKLIDNEMSENYVKNNTYFFNKHLKSLCMPYKTKKEQVKFNILITTIKDGVKVESLKEVSEQQEVIQLDSKTGLPIVNVKKVVKIGKISPEILNKKLTELKTGSYVKRRKHYASGKHYIESISYKPATAHQFIKVFGPMFEYAVDKKYIKVNPMARLKAPKYNNERNFTLSNEEQQKLYKALMTYPEDKFRAIFMFLLNGRRKNEALTLRWEDINFDEGFYTIRYFNSKNRQEYNYELPEHIKTLLQSLANKNERKGLVFKSDKTGGKIDNFDKRWKTILDALGITDVTRHDMRRWLGNTAINAGKTTSEIASALGHSDDRTVKRYAKVSREVAAKVADNFHEHFGG